MKRATFSIKIVGNHLAVFYLIKQCLPEWSMENTELVGPDREGDVAPTLVSIDHAIGRGFVDMLVRMGYVD